MFKISFQVGGDSFNCFCGAVKQKKSSKLSHLEMSDYTGRYGCVRSACGDLAIIGAKILHSDT